MADTISLDDESRGFSVSLEDHEIDSLDLVNLTETERIIWSTRLERLAQRFRTYKAQEIDF